MDSLKLQLETMKLHEHGNDDGAMLTKMMSIYTTLKDNGHEPDSFCCYLYTYLLSGPNANFNAFIQCIVDNKTLQWIQSNITADELAIDARMKYNNMIEDKL